MVRPKMTMPKKENDQQCSSAAKGATPRSGTAPSARPATVKDSLAHHTSLMPDPVKWLREWVKVYVERMRTHPTLWSEFLTLNQECLREVAKMNAQQQAKKQAAAFWLPTAEFEKADWWDPPPSLHNLQCNKFLPPRSLGGSQDIQELCDKRTLALFKALQSYAQWSCGPYHVMCGNARILQACMTDLKWFREENILDAMLFEPLDNQQLVSPNLEAEISHFSEPQEAQAAAIHPPRCKEQAPEPKNATELMVAAAESQGIWVCLPWLGFESLPPKQYVPLIGISNPYGSKSALALVGAMIIVVYKTRWWANLSISMRHIVSGHCAQSHPITDPRSLSCES